MTLDGYHVVGHQVLCASGCFRRERYWLSGWPSLPDQKHVQYIYGFTGKETVVTVETITPCVIFDVIDKDEILGTKTG